MTRQRRLASSYQRLLGRLGVGLAVTATTLAGTLVSPGLALAPAAAVDLRPNILLITSDDQRLDDMVVMDNVNAMIAAEGTSFTNYYDSFSLCCPARASIMTGQYAHNHGVIDNAPTLGGFAELDGTSTLSTWMHDAGYWTAFTGKYLNHYGEVPVSVPPGWDDWHAEVSGGDYFNSRIFENGRASDYPGVYQTDLFGGLSADVVTASAARDKPFFMWASFYAPHSGTPVEPDDPINTLGYAMDTPVVAP